MVSMRFPFSSFPKPPSNGRGVPHVSSRSIATVTAVAAGATVAAAVSQSHLSKFLNNASSFLLSNINGSDIPMWATLSLDAGDPVTENRTGVSFPATVGGSRRLLGVGLRRKSVFGLKNIDVYAFGVYADNGEISELLGEKYGKVSLSEIKYKNDLINELMESDVGMTVRLQIVFGKLSIGSVRSAFEVSVGSKIQKYGGSDNKELLQRFTSQFKDEYKIPRGSIIDLSRERGNVLHTTIDGKEVGSIQSKLLCRSVLDLYIGDDPFDRKAKEDIELNLVSFIQK